MIYTVMTSNNLNTPKLPVKTLTKAQVTKDDIKEVTHLNAANVMDLSI